MKTEVLRIIEGGLANDKRKIVNYARKLADRLEDEGDTSLANCIRKKIEDLNHSSSIVSDALRSTPLDADSRLQMVEIIPPANLSHKIVLDPLVQKQIDEFVKIISCADQIESLGIDIPKTLILYGNPGCGKTSLAQYVSQATGLPLVLARLDSLVSSLLGSTSKNIRKIFDYAKDFPCILFLDEFDAIAKARDDNKEIGELKRVINSLLQNIDSMPSHCILIAATNHPELLDRAVWRRFLQKVEVSMPGKDEIEQLIHVFSEDCPQDFMDNFISNKSMVSLFEGLAPAEIKLLFDRARIKSIIDPAPHVAISHLLISCYELSNGEKTEEGYVDFLYSKGLTHRSINELTGISLRQIKKYLTEN